MSLRFTAVLALTFLMGCGRYFAPDINLDRYATMQDIVGHWSMDPKSLEIATRDGYAPPLGEVQEIVFHATGECEYRSMDCATDSNNWRPTYVDARGTWTLEHDTKHSSTTIRKNEVMIRIGYCRIGLSLTERDGRILLWEFWGDPDSWEFIEYGKVY